MKLSNEFKVGVLTIVTMALLIAGYNFLKGTTLLTKGRSYTIEYKYIPGLKKGDPIQINGYQIGRVNDIILENPKEGTIQVKVNVTEDVDIPVDSRAIIKSADLLGEKFIDLRLGSATEVYQNGDHFAGEIEADLTNQIKEELKPLTEKVQSMIVSVDTAITVMSSIFTPTFKDNFETSVTNIKQTLESFNSSARMLDNLLASQQGRIEGIISDVSTIAANVDKNERNLNAIIQNLETVTANMAEVDWQGMSQSIDSVVNGLNDIIVQVNSGEGSLGALVYSDELINNLNKITATLDEITLELQANPGKYMPPIIQIGGNKNKEK